MNRMPFPAPGGRDRPDDSGLDAFEAQLRDALTDRADSIVPNDRWLQIQVGTADSRDHEGTGGPGGTVRTLRRARSGRATRSGMPQWLLPVAASVLTLLLGAGVWVATRPRLAQPAPAATGIVEEWPADTSRGLTTLATTAWSAPIYYVQTQPDSSWALQRDFVPAQLTDRSASARVTLALTTIVSGTLPSGEPMPAYLGYTSPWQAGTTVTSTVSETAIEVRLSRPGRSELPAEQQRVAVQSLVWTATAAAQQNVPVRVATVDDSGVFATVPAGPYKRPAEAYQDLAPIWITDPLRFIKVISTRPIIIDGQACVFEGALSWQLRSASGALVKSGTTTAKSGCPTRGTWRIELGMLAAGDYELRVFSTSAQDGSVDAEAVSPFRVS